MLDFYRTSRVANKINLPYKMRKKLSWMKPVFFCQKNSLPLSSDGKLDFIVSRNPIFLMGLIRSDKKKAFSSDPCWMIFCSANCTNNKRQWKTSSFPMKSRQNWWKWVNWWTFFTSHKIMRNCSKLDLNDKFPEVLRMLWWKKEYLIEEHFYVKGCFKLHVLGSVQAS